MILRGVLPREVTDRVVRLISFHGKIREIGMLGKVISGILEVVDRVGGGEGPPRMGCDGFQLIQSARTRILKIRSCALFGTRMGFQKSCS